MWSSPFGQNQKNKHYCCCMAKKTLVRKKEGEPTTANKTEIYTKASVISRKSVILITNDEGITVSGIMILVESVKDLVKVIVVAPDNPQFGMGHAITIGQPLRLQNDQVFEGIESYSCTGTPV